MAALILAGVSLDLVAPLKMSERWAPSNAMRPGCEVLVMAAALGLCSSIRKHVPYRHDILAFGADVIDFLTSDERSPPASMAEIIGAGGTALRLCMTSLVDVEGAGDFSGPPVGTPTAGGQSSGGGSTPAN